MGFSSTGGDFGGEIDSTEVALLGLETVGASSLQHGLDPMRNSLVLEDHW